MRKTALAIRHVAFEDLGTFESVLREQDYEIQYTDAGVDDLGAIDPLAADLVALLGGPIGAYEGDVYPFLRDELRLAEKRLAADRPMIGICLGAQLIARALGARVYPGPQKEIGWSPLTVNEAGMSTAVRHLAGPATNMLHWHGDTFDLPVGATFWASSALFENQIFSWGTKTLAFQCHPEIEVSSMERWFIGHACELAAAKISVNHLREQTRKFGPSLEIAGSRCLRDWLDSVK